LAFRIQIDKDVVRRILAQRYRPGQDSGGSSWLTFLGHMKGWCITLESTPWLLREMTADDARAAAHRRFGNTWRKKVALRGAGNRSRTWRPLDSVSGWQC